MMRLISATVSQHKMKYSKLKIRFVKQYIITGKAYGAFLQSRHFVIRRFVVSMFCSVDVL
jgi:hypothetical protein